MSPKDEFTDYQGKLLGGLLELTKASQFLGNQAELGYYRNASPAFATLLDVTTDSLLDSFGEVLAFASGNKAMHNLMSAGAPESFVDQFGPVVEVVDDLLERTDMLLDSFRSGRPGRDAATRFSAVQPAQEEVMIALPASQGQMTSSPGTAAAGGKRTLLSTTASHLHVARNLPRPQLRFADKVDNSNYPALPKLRYKPNALRPLEAAAEGEDEAGALAVSAEMGQHLQSIVSSPATPMAPSNPYEYEITHIMYPPTLYEIKLPRAFSDMGEAGCTWVETLEGLEMVVSLLSAVDVFAVDLEHHDYRSFQGFTCLMQLSTKDEDFLVDTLALRAHMHLLNVPFTNPAIIKVFHGASSDIEWLQKDFGLYVVGMFDTYHASHALSMPEHSLAYLLRYYCEVHTDKKYQLADWRIRPLSDEMLKYARSDTHYLIYIFDCMRNALLEKSTPGTFDLLSQCMERSAATSLKVYCKPIYDAEDGLGKDGWKALLRKSGTGLTPEQFAVLRVVHGWRDHIARQEDESVRYIMPNHMLLNLVHKMPTSPEGVMAACNPVPIFVKAHAFELCKMIEQSRVSYRLAAEEKGRELERIRAEIASREQEWRERKKAGPTHIRFGEAQMQQQQAKCSSPRSPPPPSPTSPAAAGKAPPSSMPGPRGRTKPGQGLPATSPPPLAEALVQRTSSFFGPLLQHVPPSDAQRALQQRAEAIRTSLSLAAPRAEEMFTVRAEGEQIEEEEGSFDEDTKTSSGPGGVISARTTTGSSSPTTLAASLCTIKVAKAGDLGAESIPLPIIVSDAPSKKSKKSKKNKSKGSKQERQDSHLPEPTPAATSTGDAVAPFTPFDYDAHSAVGASSSKPKRKSDTSFNPYGGSGQPTPKKPKSAMKGKSGNKSIKF